jgi:hypothetical protein
VIFREALGIALKKTAAYMMELFVSCPIYFFLKNKLIAKFL